MDIVSLTFHNRKSHHSDEIAVEIQPFGVEPEPPPVAAGLGLLLVAGLILYAVSRRKKE